MICRCRALISETESHDLAEFAGRPSCVHTICGLAIWKGGPGEAVRGSSETEPEHFSKITHFLLESVSVLIAVDQADM